MRFRKYQASVYDDQTVVVRNPDNGQIVLLSDDEASALQYMERAEPNHVLDILFPEAGIAKKDHIRATLSAIAKMKRAGLLDLPSADPRIKSGTLTMEIDVSREKIRLEGLDSMAATLAGVFGKVFSLFGATGVAIFTLALSGIAVVFFPFGSAEAFLNEGPSYAHLIWGTYFSVCVALSFRSVLQIAFLKGYRRNVDEVRFSFFGPFLYIRTLGTTAWLLGMRGRLLYSVVGLLSPIAFAGVFVVLQQAKIISMLTLWTVFTSAVGGLLLLLCPLIRADGSDILSLFLHRYQPKGSAAIDARDALLQKTRTLSKEGGVTLLAALVWFLVYLDLLRSYWEVWSFRVVPDLMSPVNMNVFMGASTAALGFLLLALLPPLGCFYLLFRGILLKNKKTAIVPLPEGAQVGLDFDEQMSALEKVPLFAALESQDRLALFNEMQLVTFKDGDSLVKQGEIGDEFFVLIRGKARAVFQDFKGKQHIVNELGEGDAFGEIALLDDVPRTASVVSLGTANVLILKKSSFERVVQNLGTPEKVKQMIRLTSFFRRHPLFSKLSPREQADLIHAFNFEILAPGDEVREDHSGDHFYVVYSGKLRVDTGDDATDTTIESDDCFGYNKGIHTKIVASDGAGLLRIRKEQFDSLIWQKLVERPELFI